VVIGQTNTLSFQVVNGGGLTLTGAVSATLPFAIAGGSPFNLPPGQTGQVQVTFSPTSAGSFSNVVVFTSNGGNSANTVTGSGLTPAQLGVSPASLNFGTVEVGSSAQASFVLTNQGGVALTNGLAIISPGSPGFSIVSGTPFTLAGFASTNVIVRFAPTSAASFSNVVVFSTDNGGSSTNALTGTGAVAPAASFSGSPTSGLKPLTVSFADNSSGTITNRFWDFGDSSTTNTSATNFSHTYLAAGTNTVSLTVSGPLGTDTFPLANYIVVTNGGAAPIRITSLQLAGTNVIIRFETVAGFVYVLENTETLNGNWATNGTNITGTGDIIEVTDTGISATSRFYRVRQLP